MSRHTGWFKEILDCHPETDDSKLTLHRSDIRPRICVPLNSNHMYKSCFPQISTSRSTSSGCKSMWLERVGVQQWSELVSVKYLTFAHFIKPKGRGSTRLGPLPSTWSGQSNRRAVCPRNPLQFRSTLRAEFPCRFGGRHQIPVFWCDHGIVI